MGGLEIGPEKKALRGETTSMDPISPPHFSREGA